MPHSIVKPVAGTATQLVAANTQRLSLSIKNTSQNVTLYVNQTSNTTSSAGNKTLFPGDAVEFEGAAAKAAYFGITDTAVPVTPQVSVTEVI